MRIWGVRSAPYALPTVPSASRRTAVEASFASAHVRLPLLGRLVALRAVRAGRSTARPRPSPCTSSGALHHARRVELLHVRAVGVHPLEDDPLPLELGERAVLAVEVLRREGRRDRRLGRLRGFLGLRLGGRGRVLRLLLGRRVVPGDRRRHADGEDRGQEGREDRDGVRCHHGQRTSGKSRGTRRPPQGRPQGTTGPRPSRSSSTVDYLGVPSGGGPASAGPPPARGRR